MHGRVDIIVTDFYQPLSCAVEVGVASGAWADLTNFALSRDLSILLLIFLETPLVKSKDV